MKSFDRLFAAVLIVFAVAAVTVNICVRRAADTSAKQYLVDASRICSAFEAGTVPNENDYPTVSRIVRYDGEDGFFDCSSEYVIREAGGELYRIEYDDGNNRNDSLFHINMVFALCGIIILGVMIFIRQKIIKPFNRLSTLPYELSKGNITIPLTEQKSRFFGKFIWGLDMLRETLEKSGKHELEQAKAEKTLLLSLSHDIKTPLSGIKLNAKALSKGIYSDGERQKEAAERIASHADEIERYVNEMIGNLSNDFMKLEVSCTEFYIDDVINTVREQYKDRLAACHTDFDIGEHTNCMLNGDPDRLTEVLQNILENAVKYGDGKEISISFTDEEDCRLICVKNSGCTLSGNELSHIFDSFWRGSNTSGKDGSGLGLYICRRLMQGMGGDIFADIEDGYMMITAVCKRS